MKDNPHAAANRLAEALDAKDRWRRQEINYNRAIQEEEEELASAMVAQSLTTVDVNGYTFALCTDGRINIARTP